MKNKYISESSMEDSYIYKSFNASNALVERIIKYVKSAVALDKTYFEEQYSQIKKTNISPLSPKVLEAFDNGIVELLYSTNTKMTISVPFIIRKSNGKVVATIFISSFSTLDKDDNLTIPVKQLYALMESAYVAWQLQVNPMKIQRNIGLMRLCNTIYTQMILRILNKDYALSLDKVLYDKASYAISRFFLSQVWMYPNPELIESYASIDLKNIENLDLSLTKQGYDSEDIKSIDDLMRFLSTLSPRMKEVNTRYFIERFINTYHGSSIMSIDYLPYLFFVIINILLSSFLISQVALNDVVKNTNGITKFYVELSKLI